MNVCYHDVRVGRRKAVRYCNNFVFVRFNIKAFLVRIFEKDLYMFSSFYALDRHKLVS